MGHVMDVNYNNEQYEYHLSIWQTIRDCVSGEKAIKDRDYEWSNSASNQANALTGENSLNFKPVYLPMPNVSDQSYDNKLRYAQYIQRASFYGATARTLNGLVGMMFKKPPEYSFPSDMEYLEDNVDGSGVGISGQAHEVARDAVSVGRVGLYVDYPRTDGEVTREEVENSGIRATINAYCTESIKDWDCISIGASSVLSYVKLEEIVCERDENFVVQEVCYYRCLFLEKKDGKYVYVVRVYDEKGEVSEEFTPKDGSGSTLNHIPFYFIGSLNNRPSVDDAPLQEIADINIKHYRNSADFEESAFIVGQPTLFIGGFNESWMKDFYSNGIPFGSRAGIAGPAGSAASLIQAAPNSMPADGMKHKEEQMISLGARLITNGGQAETAEAARIKHESDVSSLSVIVANINKAYSLALMDVANFTYTSESQANSAYKETSFEVNTAFFDTAITPEQGLHLVSIWQSGAIDKDVLDRNLKKGNIIPEMKDLEEMNESIENSMTGFTPDA